MDQLERAVPSLPDLSAQRLRRCNVAYAVVQWASQTGEQVGWGGQATRRVADSAGGTLAIAACLGNSFSHARKVTDGLTSSGLRDYLRSLVSGTFYSFSGMNGRVMCDGYFGVQYTFCSAVT